MFQYIVLMIMFFVFNLNTGVCKDLIKHRTSGSINWTEGYVYAKGMGPVDSDFGNDPRGKLIAKRVAVVDCQRNLLEIVKGVQVTSTKIVSKLMDEKDIVKTTVSGIIKNAEIVNERFDKEEGIFYIITMKMPFSGKFIETVIDNKMMTTSINYKNWFINLLALHHICSNAWASTIHSVNFNSSEKDTLQKVLQLFQQSGVDAGMSKIKNVIADFEKYKLFSGVVINALNVNQFRPALCARLRKKNGEVVYPGKLVNLKNVSSSLLYSWNDNLKEATKTKRVKDNPIIIKSNSIYKNQKSDLIISDQDAEAIILWLKAEM